jgi:hypothetical protein
VVPSSPPLALHTMTSWRGMPNSGPHQLNTAIAAANSNIDA